MAANVKTTALTCTVCGLENDSFSVKCSACGSFLQNRIPNIDLFDMLWKVIESPSKAFREIVFAEHKNFWFALMVINGIFISFTSKWLMKIGDRYENLLDIIIRSLLDGMAYGILILPLCGLFYHLTVKALSGKANLRSSLGIFSFSLTPLLVALVVFVPIDLLTFGQFLFTANPDPYVIKPASFIALVAVKSACVVWSIVLLAVGTTIGHRIPMATSIAVGIAGIGCIIGVSYIVSGLFGIHL
jgi:hypothetical protein